MKNQKDRTKIKLLLTGRTTIMFDRYAGMKEVLSWKEKAYTVDGGILVMPSINIMSFLSAQNTESATQRTIGRGWKTIAKAAMSFISFEKEYFHIMRGTKNTTVDDLKLDQRTARVKKGSLAIPQDKERPVLETPWEIKIILTLFRNPDLSEETLKRIFVDGGIQVGLGTFRGMFGKFDVTRWDHV